MDKDQATFLFVRYYHNLLEVERFKKVLPFPLPSTILYWFQVKENTYAALSIVCEEWNLKEELAENFVRGYYETGARYLFPQQAKQVYVSPPSNY